MTGTRTGRVLRKPLMITATAVVVVTGSLLGTLESVSAQPPAFRMERGYADYPTKGVASATESASHSDIQTRHRIGVLP